MKQFIKNFNNFLKKTIFKVQNKTNNNFIKNFNNYVEKTIFKVQNKTNNNFKISNYNKISNFNKYLITFISLLFFFFYFTYQYLAYTTKLGYKIILKNNY